MSNSINWPTLARVADRYGQHSPFQNQTVLINTHAKKPAASLVRSCVRLGGEVLFCPIGYSANEHVLADLEADRCVKLIAAREILQAASQANIVFEDGARVGRLLVDKQVLLRPGVFSVEQTTSGIRYYEAVSSKNLPYPVFNVAESRIKLELENALATPWSILAAFSSATQASLSGKSILLIGYGPVGQGLARLCRATGGHITVLERDPVRRLLAYGQGFRTIDKEDFHSTLEEQDVVVSCTSNAAGRTLGIEELCLLKEGSIVFNSGSGRGELSEELTTPGQYRRHRATITIRTTGQHNLCTIEKGGMEKDILILGKGHPINLRLADGSPAETIELVFALMLLTAVKAISSPLERAILPVNAAAERELSELLEASSKHHPMHVAPGDLVESERPFGSVTPIGKSSTFLQRLSLARAIFRPGSETAGHYHLRAEEVYIVESGSATITVWNIEQQDRSRQYELEGGHFLRVPPGFAHRVVVTSSDPFIALVAASPAFSAWDQYFLPSQYEL